MLLIRHGETDWNNKLIFQGHSDKELNETGLINARKTAEILKNYRFDYIYCSDLKRAKQTAQLIANKMNKSILETKEIREIFFGEWEGLNFKKIEKNYPDEFQAWKNDPLKNNPPEGEKIEQFNRRVNGFFDKLIKNHRGEKIIVVTHGGVIKSYLTEILAVSKNRYWQFQIDNNSITELKFYEDAAVLSKLNFLCENNFK